MGTCDTFEKLDTIDDLPTLPAIAMEVNRLLEDHDTSIKQLSEMIEKDQSIVSKLLKLVNSAFFGLRSQVSDVPHALTLLGFSTVRNVVVSISVINTFAEKKVATGFDIKEFWTHSVAVAVTSKHLAERTKLQSPDQAFIGGLLHDIGKVVLASFFQDRIKEIWKATKKDNLSFYDAEKERDLVDHARIGGYLAGKWRLPQCLVDTIKNHHDMNGSAHGPNPEMIVHMADAIINAWHPDSGETVPSPAWDAKSSGILQSQMDTLAEWFPKASEEINSAYQFFITDGEND